MTSNVLNNPDVSKWLGNNQMESFENNRIALLGDLSKQMNALFGKHNAVFKGEYNLKIWHLNHDGEFFVVNTGKGYGTSYEIVLKDGETIKKKTKEIIGFLSELEESINKEKRNERE